jgi:putative restriction endonuclease
VLAASRSTPEEELMWREAVWAELQNCPTWPNVPPALLRELRVYSGQAGVWFDQSSTRQICPSGIAVSVLNTGHHYDDVIDEDAIIYHYPTTARRGLHDQNEVDSVKQAEMLQIPIFVIINNGNWRQVKRARVTDNDDVSRSFLIEFSEHQHLKIAIELDQVKFSAKTDRKLSIDQVVRVERDPRFKFQVIKRHAGKCVVTGLSVIEMLDGAHVVPVADGGSDDPRNGLLLSASHHRAYDKHLWSINPRTLEIETSPKGPSLKQMKFERTDVGHLQEAGTLPHVDALEIRYEMFSRAIAS